LTLEAAAVDCCRVAAEMVEMRALQETKETRVATSPQAVTAHFQVSGRFGVSLGSPAWLEIQGQEAMAVPYC
jgi:hypothetical protein